MQGTSTPLKAVAPGLQVMYTGLFIRNRPPVVYAWHDVHVGPGHGHGQVALAADSPWKSASSMQRAAVLTHWPTKVDVFAIVAYDAAWQWESWGHCLGTGKFPVGTLNLAIESAHVYARLPLALHGTGNHGGIAWHWQFPVGTLNLTIDQHMSTQDAPAQL